MNRTEGDDERVAEPSPARPPIVDTVDTHDSEQPAGLDDAQLYSALEAVLMVAAAPVQLEEFARVTGEPVHRVRSALEHLKARSEHAQLVTDFVGEGSSSRLSQAALETLAVVAYLQPVSRSRVSAIRGVNVDGVVRTLVQRGLLTAHEREEATGSVLYSTTPLFLEKLGLGSLDELPDIAPLLPGTDQLDDIED